MAISTHTPLARRDCTLCGLASLPEISTHTPLARRDLRLIANEITEYDFYSHASCEA